MKKDNALWHNGKILSPGTAHISADDRGFLLADGVFETMLARQGRVILLKEHLQRLTKSMRALEIPQVWRPQDLQRACHDLLCQNNLTARARLRLTVTRGKAGLEGLQPPNLCQPVYLLTANKAPKPRSALRLVFATTVRRNEQSLTAQIKSTSYTDNIIAQMEATKRKAHSALLLNSRGTVACAASANVFLIEKDTLITPSCKDGALNGIIRNAILKESRRLKLVCLEQTITPERLMHGDGVFLTNSILGVAMVRSLEKKRFAPHPLAQQLKNYIDRLI